MRPVADHRFVEGMSHLSRLCLHLYGNPLLAASNDGSTDEKDPNNFINKVGFRLAK